MPTNALRAALYQTTRSWLTYAWLALFAILTLASAWSGARYTAGLALPPADLLANWTQRALIGISSTASIASALLAINAIQLYCDNFSTGFIKNLLTTPAARTSHTLATFAVLAFLTPLYLLVGLALQALAALVWGLPLEPLLNLRTLVWCAQALAGMFAMGCVGLLVAHLCRRITLSIALLLFHGTILTELLRLFDWFEPAQPLLQALREAVYIPSVVDAWSGVFGGTTWAVLIAATIAVSLAASLLLAKQRSVA